LAFAACGNSGTSETPQTGGATGTGGHQAGGSGGAVVGTGGATSSGGSKGSGGASGTGGSAATGGTGSAATGGSGGATTPAGSGGKSGNAGTGGRIGPGGQTGFDGGIGPGAGGAKGTGGSTSGTVVNPDIDGGAGVNCAATMPTEGAKSYTGSSVNGTVNGLNYGIWTNGSGGTITVYPNAHAFSASWNNSQDFLAHLGLDFRPGKAWTEYGTIAANYVEKKSGSGGGFSMIGMYGWTQNPCVEWYINEDSYNGLGARGNVTVTIDGGTYYLSTVTTTGTGGANACESGHQGSWTQMISTRKGARTCGTVTVSDHFKAWEAQGWKLGVLTMVHINVEVGGGVGSIDFPVAEVTTTSK
jgi:hypothetical protein